MGFLLSPLSRAAVLVALSVAGLSGCSIEAGTAAAGHFTDWAEGHPMEGVRVAQVDSNDVLPGIGNATALLDGEPGTDPDAVLDHFCAYPESKAPVRLHLRYDLASGAQMTMPLECEDGTVPDVSGYERLDGVTQVDLLAEPVVLFDTTKALAAGLPALDGLYERGIVATTDSLYVHLDAGASPEVVAATADVALLARRWRITQIVVTPGEGQRPDRVGILVRGTRLGYVREDVRQVVGGVDAKFRVVQGPR